MQALYRVDDVVVTDELAEGHNDGVVRSRWGVDGAGALVLVEDYDESRDLAQQRRLFLDEIKLRAAADPGVRAFHRGGYPLTLRPAHPGVRLDRFLDVNAAERGRPPLELGLAVARALMHVVDTEDPDMPLSTLVWLGFDGAVTGVPTLVPRFDSWTSDYDLERPPDVTASDGYYAAGVNLCRLLFGRYDAAATSAEKHTKLLAFDKRDEFLDRFALSLTLRDDDAMASANELDALARHPALLRRLLRTRRRATFNATDLATAARMAELPARHPEIARVLAGLFPKEHAAARTLLEQRAMLERDVAPLGDVARIDLRYADELRRIDDGPAGFP